MSYSINNEQIIKLLKFDNCQSKYPFLFEAFNNLTVKQLNYIIPKSMKESGTKKELIYYLMIYLKTKYINDNLKYKNPFEFLFEDNTKLNVDTLDYLLDYEDDCIFEWVDFLANKFY